MDFWSNLGISIVFGIINATVKNPSSREKMRRVLTKLRDQLNALYPPDEFPAGTSRISDEQFGLQFPPKG